MEEFFSGSAFWTLLLIAHGLLSVALLGALTHQAMAVLRSKNTAVSGTPNFIRRFSAVAAPAYVNVVCALWVLSFILGGWIYSEYRIAIRIPMEQQELFKTVGAFELKEHMAVFGLGLLPYYNYLWKNSVSTSEESARRWVTVFLAAACWYTFLAGHIVNNARGFGS